MGYFDIKTEDKVSNLSTVIMHWKGKKDDMIKCRRRMDFSFIIKVLIRTQDSGRDRRKLRGMGARTIVYWDKT